MAANDIFDPQTGRLRYGVNLAVTIYCSTCRETATMDTAFVSGSTPLFTLPPGWTPTPWGSPLCPKHDLVAVDKERDDG